MTWTFTEFSRKKVRLLGQVVYVQPRFARLNGSRLSYCPSSLRAAEQSLKLTPLPLFHSLSQLCCALELKRVQLSSNR